MLYFLCARFSNGFQLDVIISHHFPPQIFRRSCTAFHSWTELRSGAAETSSRAAVKPAKDFPRGSAPARAQQKFLTRIIRLHQILAQKLGFGLHTQKQNLYIELST